MTLTLTKSERPHIAFMGCTNSGKSSVVNAVTNQAVSIISDVSGTTTDAVQKSMEILPLGAVVIIDTAGVNDGSAENQLGELRVKATKRIIDKTDIAVLVIDSSIGFQKDDNELLNEFKQRQIPYLIVYNKSDKLSPEQLEYFQKEGKLLVSALKNEGIDALREALGHIINENKSEKFIIKDRLKSGDVVVLVIPIDESAPKGRIILPQQNVLREILDAHALAVCCQENELVYILEKITPKYVITDSQVFNRVKDLVPEDVMLTSFSILMANYKGKLDELLRGAKCVLDLDDGDIVLISEGCTHHRQCNDIGTVKLPKWIKEYTGKNINYDFTQGGEFPEDLNKYKLIIHCGACMLNEAEMQSRIKKAKSQNVPIVNYGIVIAQMNGILDRATKIFDERS